MRLGIAARTVSPLSYADLAAPVLERAVINLIEIVGGRSALVALSERWRAQWPLDGIAICALAEKLSRPFETLQAGRTIVIFPAGGVSAAPLKFSLGQFARTNVLPGRISPSA